LDVLFHYHYWGLARPPFGNVPDTEFYFKTSQHVEAISRLLYAVKGRKGSAMLTGEVGCGKTLICYKLLERFKRDKYETVIIYNPSFSGVEFLQQIYQGIGGHPVPDSKRELLQALIRHAESKSREGRQIVILVDEAHLITKSPDLCEEIRMLLNYHSNGCFLFTLLLVGQPELLSSITRIPQLRQRIHIKYHLLPLNQLETYNYVLHRLKFAENKREVFSLSALEEVYHQSKGVPRVINTICDLSMLAAFLAKHDLVEREDVLNILELMV